MPSGPYRLAYIDADARQYAASLPKKDQGIIAEKIGFVLKDPYRIKTKQLEGVEWEQQHGQPVRRIRAGDHRILYCVDDEEREVSIVEIGLRPTVYGGH